MNWTAWKGIRASLLGLSCWRCPRSRGGQANTCNGIVTIDYVTGFNFAVPGDILRVRLTLGTGSINGGTQLTINRLRFQLDWTQQQLRSRPALYRRRADGRVRGRRHHHQHLRQGLHDRPPHQRRAERRRLHPEYPDRDSGEFGSPTRVLQSRVRRQGPGGTEHRCDSDRHRAGGRLHQPRRLV
jgi:hypothetical protein